MAGVAQTGKSREMLLNFGEFKKILNSENTIQNSLESDDATLIAKALTTAGNSKILYLPEGHYLLKKRIQLHTSGLHIRGAGAGKTIVSFDSAFAGNGELFQSNGASNITIEGITFTGQAKRIKAVLGFNSYPNACKNIRILNCEFTDLWADEVINFGATALNESHSTDLVFINHCRFYNIYNPAFPVVTNDTDPRCNAINLQQTTLRANIQHCQFENISGDGIFGWGWSQNPANVNPLYGNWTIHHNEFRNCWMCIEINGNGLGRGLDIHYNNFRCSTHDGGFLVSVDGYKAKDCQK